MAGLSGWVDYERDLTTERPTAARLVAEEATRGPDGEGVWHSARAVLGQRTDATWSGPVGPARIEEDGRTIAVAVCDGILYNHNELRAPGRGTASMSEVVLNAYLRWGSRVAAQLDGVFAFAIWDVRAEHLLLGRDPLGVKPLSYARLANGALFASEVAPLAGHPLMTPEVDTDGLCALLTHLRTPGNGVLRGVREVPPGCTVAIGRDSMTVERYWEFAAQPHTLDLPATIARGRELLDDVLARMLRDIEPAVLLSGGLDSSGLTGLAAAATGAAPRTFTVVFGDTAAPVPDRPFAEDVVRRWNCPHREVLVRPAELSDPSTGRAVLLAKDFPTPFGDKNITPYLFSLRVARQVPAVLSGEGADSVFGGLAGASEQLRDLDCFPWIVRARRFGRPNGIGTGLFAPELLEKLDVAGYLQRHYEQACREVSHLADAEPDDRAYRTVDYLHLTRLVEQTVLHSERLGTAAGLQVRFPFVDPRLLTFFYNVPAWMKAFDGRAKSLLRAMVRDVVPPSVLTRAKVPYPITYDAGYKASLVRRMGRLFDDADAPILPLLDLAAARRLVAEPGRLDRGGWYGRADIEMVLQLNDWLRWLRVRIRI